MKSTAFGKCLITGEIDELRYGSNRHGSIRGCLRGVRGLLWSVWLSHPEYPTRFLRSDHDSSEMFEVPVLVADMLSVCKPSFTTCSNREPAPWIFMVRCVGDSKEEDDKG